MKYGILILVIVAALLMLRSHLYSQDGADRDELELLKEAWKRHQQEKEDENPGGQNSETQDPLEALERGMRAVERRLSREDPGDKTQEKQREVLELLDDLIKQAQDAQQSQSESEGGGSEKTPQPRPGESPGEPQPLVDPSGPKNPAKPGADLRKQILKKTGKDSEVRIPGRGGKGEDRWGEMTPRARMKALEEPANEKRPVKHQKLIEEYFRRLLKGSSGR